MIVDGTGGRNGTAALYPRSLTRGGNLYFADGAHCIRKIAPDGTTTTLAGNHQAGLVDGPGASAQFRFPYGVAVDGEGYVYVTDYANHAIRRVAPDGTTATLAGNGTSGFADGVGCDARFYDPRGIAIVGNQLSAGAGSTFFFSLPIAAPGDAHPLPPAPPVA
jgi:hypothetical protein